MKWSINAGRLFGIKFRIHATFFLLLLYVFLSDIKAGFGQAGLSVLFVCRYSPARHHELSMFGSAAFRQGAEILRPNRGVAG
jgi:hypothetical protein